MIHKIIDFSAHNKFVVFLLVGVAVAAGWWSMQNVPLDAIPDLSDTQVIVYSRWDRSPDIMEDQVTYPIITALLGAPHVKDIRGFSDFGYSYVYIIFDEGTDIYWARSRTLEYLSKITQRLPQGVQTELGPDATSIGWVFQYALVDTTGKQSLDAMRSYQDWYLRYYVESVPGVAEVAPIGGLVRQYQIQLDPYKLNQYKIPLMKVVEAVRASNNDVGGRLVEFASREYMVRGRGYARSVADLRDIVVGGDIGRGVPITVGDVGQVTLGPDIRRGVADLDGKGDAVGGVVIMRSGENALRVIDRVKAKLDQIKPSLPPGVKVVTTYDRSELILGSIHTLKHTLYEEIGIVSLVILLFLWHIPSALIPILTIPITVLISFIPMKAVGVTSNIMSLGGIAIAIGAMVDAAIVVVEQTHKKLEVWEADGRKRDYREVVVEAIKEVAPASFFSLLVIAVSFMPIFALEAQEGRLFKPLAFTKNFSMAIAAVLAITLDPAMRLLFTHATEFSFRPRFLARAVNAVLVGKIHPEEKHPISRILIKLYRPVVEVAVKARWIVIAAAIATVVVTIPVFQHLGSEFMPPLNEGTLLYMPTTLPGISVAQAQRVLEIQDRTLKSFPEVERVFGKAGRAETSTDPAPLSMVETTVLLKPASEWPGKPRWYTGRTPEWTQKIFRHIWPDRISQDDLVDEMDRALRIPGTSNAWTMPIRNRVDMLTTGVRTPVGVKVLGADLEKIQEIGIQIEHTLANVPGTRSVYAERVSGGYFLDFNLRRDQLARYGLTVDDVESYIMTGIGGDNVTTTVEGRERYSVNVRYLRDYRSDLGSLGRIQVSTPSGLLVPLSQLADIRLVEWPSMIRDENGLESGYVYVDVAGRDLGSYVDEAQKLVRENVEPKLPAGYSLSWSGQYEFLQRVRERLKLVVPITIILVFILLYLNTKSVVKTLIIFAAVPFSAVGAIWFLHVLGYNMSIAVWVGLIALMGVDAETGVFMLLYLDLAYEQWKKEGLLTSFKGLQDAIVHGAAARVRPKVMTVGCMFTGLFPIMWSTGTGADVMKRIAAPMVGGIFTSFILELLVYPAIYAVWKWNFEVKRQVVGSRVRG
jgi:Cu(I)/Ag(I) efflux system membrane protein CusA/SilA